MFDGFTEFDGDECASPTKQNIEKLNLKSNTFLTGDELSLERYFATLIFPLNDI